MVRSRCVGAFFEVSLQKLLEYGGTDCLCGTKSVFAQHSPCTRANPVLDLCLQHLFQGKITVLNRHPKRMRVEWKQIVLAQQLCFAIHLFCERSLRSK